MNDLRVYIEDMGIKLFGLSTSAAEEAKKKNRPLIHREMTDYLDIIP